MSQPHATLSLMVEVGGSQTTVRIRVKLQCAMCHADVWCDDAIDMNIGLIRDVREENLGEL